MAEREGFEPPEEYYPSTVFKTVALNRSATSPNRVCQINILAGVQALAWFCQTKVWTPFLGVQALACLGVQALACLGVQALACLGVQALACLGVQALACLGVQALAWFCQTKVWTPFLGVKALACLGVQALAWFCQT